MVDNMTTTLLLTQAKRSLLDPFDLDDTRLQNVMDSVLSQRVDYADLFVQSLRRESWGMEDGVVTFGSFDVDQGFGLRTLEQGQTAFAFSQHIDLKHLQKAAKSVRTPGVQGRRQAVSAEGAVAERLHYITDDPLLACTTSSKIELLNRVNHIARSIDPRVVLVMASLSLEHSVNYILRYDGRQSGDIRPMLVLSMSVVVEQNGIREEANTGIGGRGDFSMFSEDKIHAALQKAVETALINLHAEASPSGVMPVVIAPGWPGMLLHEAMGHGFEGDFNCLGTSVYSGSLGARVAPAGVNIVDDGTLAGRRGSLNFDDEGHPGECTTLIEDGILVGYMHDSLSAQTMKHAPTGNGRRESYATLPMPRMTNTFMRNGQYNAQEIISSVKYGLYLANLGGGQVDIVSGNFSFQTALAYLIQDGKIAHPVKGATVTGNGPDTLRKISMVGNDLALDPGTAVCGKAGQNIPVCVGQPTLKVDALLVGGMG